ncbi:MAG: efflux RND transporter periplasmic adaptor subunit [Leptolyngbya sp. SIO4C5]|nr:efflux RND transporter periplasmic adaptor subunit [Leptolyngbya sp. SIO4C5]
MVGIGSISWRYFRQAARSADERAITDNTAAPVLTVTTLVVAEQPIEQRLEATGSVTAADLLPILPKVTGLQIKQVLVDEGEMVTAGQVLATLDTAVLKAQMRQQEAEVTVAAAAVQQAEASLQQAKATLADTETSLRRFQDLEREGAISRQDLDTSTTTFQTSQEEVRLAEANVQRAMANVQSQQARLEQLEIQLAQTEVQSPAAGLIAERFARVGDLTSGNEALFRLIRDRSLQLEVNIPETQLDLLRPNTLVDISSDSSPSLKFQGQLNSIAPLVDPETRQARLKINLPVLDQLRVGMFLRASFIVSNRIGVMVPSEALVPQPGGGNLVYRLDSENRTVVQPVELGEVLSASPNEGGNGELDESLNPIDQQTEASALIEIRSGLTAGDRIVVSGARNLNAGDLVQVVNP